MQQKTLNSHVHKLRARLRKGFDPEVMHALKRLKAYARKNRLSYPEPQPEFTCDCGAYRHPHRGGGGQCNRPMDEPFNPYRPVVLE